jgi:hypothetical protein
MIMRPKASTNIVVGLAVEEDGVRSGSVLACLFSLEAPVDPVNETKELRHVH